MEKFLHDKHSTFYFLFKNANYMPYVVLKKRTANLICQRALVKFIFTFYKIHYLFLSEQNITFCCVCTVNFHQINKVARKMLCCHPYNLDHLKLLLDIRDKCYF